MTPYDYVNDLLRTIGGEIAEPLELDEDGFLTLALPGNREITLYAGYEGDSLSLMSPLFLISEEQPLESLFREMLEHNMPGNLRSGEALALSDDAVYLILRLPVAGIGAEALKTHIFTLAQDGDAVELALREFMEGLSAGTDGGAAGQPPAPDRQPLSAGYTLDELLRNNMMRQNTRF